ncbi:PREDICTED: pentatricopeptide repeat-containing protein At1g60770-like [Nelumbo nucifera]|uniref:Pentatricopeptide repeat-containing protein At1g60770-like n=2 Tax=Nelumbo nucifera TaxID=4432 RepID=A0A1U8AKW4_NELNU|nr:PREDICTED: pentatricopeptide repeat-containing protein At1g60770-like [Nelumbo nucifera]DAD33109.1 TPA_asm: hypothetical protein HUJ06_011960 [Nelumbo nucifera]
MLRNFKRMLWRGAETSRRLCSVASQTKDRAQSRSPARRFRGSKEASNLYHRITRLEPSNEGVIQAMNDWVVNKGKTICRYDISNFVNQLRKYKQFSLALQLLEWMERRGMHLTYGDHAYRIDLLWKAEGILSAEKYFTDLPKSFQNKFTYGALLNCYCNEKMVDKAMAHLRKMRELNLASNAPAYNSLMTLHMKLGEAEKVPVLAQEMKEKLIEPDSFTYNILMSSYASLKDIEGVERVMEEVKTRSEIDGNWTMYGSLAAVYIASGLFEKAQLALKELEQRNKPKDREAFHFLLSMYASIGNAAEVNRVWQSLKSAFQKTTNLSYLTMLQTLARLDDLDGLAKCFEEWESGCSSYDIRLINVLMGAYLKRDMIQEAKLLLEKATRKGSNPNYATFMMFVDFYVKNQDMDWALKCMDTAIPKVKEHEWKLYRERSYFLLKNFEEEKDVDHAEELYRILKRANCLDQEVYNFLIRTYVVAGMVEPQMRQRMEADGIEIMPETERLLESICPD